MGRSWKRAQPQGPAPRQFLTRQNSLHWVMNDFRDENADPHRYVPPIHHYQTHGPKPDRKAPGKDYPLRAKPPLGRRFLASLLAHDFFTRFLIIGRYQGDRVKEFVTK